MKIKMSTLRMMIREGLDTYLRSTAGWLEGGLGLSKQDPVGTDYTIPPGLGDEKETENEKETNEEEEPKSARYE